MFMFDLEWPLLIIDACLKLNLDLYSCFIVVFCYVWLHGLQLGFFSFLAQQGTHLNDRVETANKRANKILRNQWSPIQLLVIQNVSMLQEAKSKFTYKTKGDTLHNRKDLTGICVMFLYWSFKCNSNGRGGILTKLKALCRLLVFFKERGGWDSGNYLHISVSTIKSLYWQCCYCV